MVAASDLAQPPPFLQAPVLSWRTCLCSAPTLCALCIADRVRKWPREDGKSHLPGPTLFPGSQLPQKSPQEEGPSPGAELAQQRGQRPEPGPGVGTVREAVAAGPVQGEQALVTVTGADRGSVLPAPGAWIKRTQEDGEQPPLSPAAGSLLPA